MNIEEQRKLGSLITSGKADEAINMLKKIDIDSDLDGRTALSLAVSYENFEIAKFALDHGANPNITATHNELTPLMIASERGDLELMKWLIDAGADVNYKNSRNVTALWSAASAEKVEACKILVEAGAEPYKELAQGLSIYNVCKQMNKGSVIEYFDSIKENCT